MYRFRSAAHLPLILCDNIQKSTVDSYSECALSTVQFVK